MRKTFINELTDIAHHNDDIYIISGDAGYGVFEEFKNTKPQRFINTGIAEANTIGYAAGLALTGFNVFIYNIIPFVLYRCFEQVRNDICYQQLPVTLIGIGSGVTYAPGGMTHYSIEDLGICQALPNLTVISPIDPIETAAAVQYAAKATSPVYIRIAKAGEPNIRQDNCPDILQPAIISEGEDIAILSYGNIFNEALEAIASLATKQIHPRLITVPTIQPFPETALESLLHGCHTVITLEEHFQTGGLASRMAELICRRRLNKKLIPLALPNKFIHDINNAQGLRKKYGIDAAAVKQAVLAC